MKIVLISTASESKRGGVNTFIMGIKHFLLEKTSANKIISVSRICLFSLNFIKAIPFGNGTNYIFNFSQLNFKSYLLIYFLFNVFPSLKSKGYIILHNGNPIKLPRLLILSIAKSRIKFLAFNANQKIIFSNFGLKFFSTSHPLHYLSLFRAVDFARGIERSSDMHSDILNVATSVYSPNSTIYCPEFLLKACLQYSLKVSLPIHFSLFLYGSNSDILSQRLYRIIDRYSNECILKTNRKLFSASVYQNLDPSGFYLNLVKTDIFFRITKTDSFGIAAHESFILGNHIIASKYGIRPKKYHPITYLTSHLDEARGINEIVDLITSIRSVKEKVFDTDIINYYESTAMDTLDSFLRILS